jgi:hypothetical protein
MPWHISRSNPLKVYDSYHAEACIAATPELAAFIVRAANAGIAANLTVPLRLQEPARPEPVKHEMDLVDEDSCCGPKLVQALNRGVNGDTWFCPTCSCEWRAHMIPEQSVRRWSPVVEVQVLPPRSRF